MNTKQKQIKGIAKLLMLAQSEQELTNLLDDLMTESEVSKIHERIRIVECLSDGLSQRETASKSGAAIATVGRGATLLKKPKLILNTFIAKARSLSWWRRLIWRA